MRGKQRILVFVALSVLFGILAGYVGNRNKQKPIVAFIALDGHAQGEIRLSAVLDDSLSVAQSIPVSASNNYAEFSLVLGTARQLGNLSLQLEDARSLRFIDLRRGNEFVHITANQMRATENGWKKDGLIDLRGPRIIHSMALLRGGAMLVLLVLCGFLLKKISFASVVISALIAAASAVLLGSMKDGIQGPELQIHLDSETGFNTPLTLYYSPDGRFQADKIIEKTADRVSENGAIGTFPLPSGFHRCLRIDFPNDSEIRLRGISVRTWLLSKAWHVGAKPLLNASFNDIHTVSLDEEILVLKTGSSDPYLRLPDVLLAEMQRAQFLKHTYRRTIAGLVFLLLLVLLNINGKNSQVVHAFGFGFILLVPGIIWAFQQDKIVFVTEKKLAAPKPVYWKGFKESARELDAYVKDHFGGRKALITTTNALKMELFNQTALSAPVFVGQDDWMFYRAEGVQELMTGKNQFSDEELELICTNLERRKRWLALYDVDLFLVFPLIKHSVYSDKLPGHFKRRMPPVSRLEQLENAIRERTDVTIVDMRNTLINAREIEAQDIYYKRDSHWNFLGAFYAYQEIAKEVSVTQDIGPILTRDHFVWHNSISKEADLTSLLLINERYPRAEVVPVPVNGYNAVEVPSQVYMGHESPNQVITRVNENDTLPVMMMNRDSFTNYLIPFLSEHFSKSVYLWTPVFDAEAVKQERPDVFITEMMERFVDDLLLPEPALITQELNHADSILNAKVVNAE